MSGSLQKNGDLLCNLSLLNKRLQTGHAIYFATYGK